MDESIYKEICFEKCFHSMELKIHDESHKKPSRTDDDELPCKSFKKNNDGNDLVSKSLKKKYQVESFIDYNRLERKYVECNVCQEICANESALRRHCESHLFQNHTTCGVCSKNFHNIYSLQEHFKSHRLYIYTCNKCDEQFGSKEGLTKHICSKTYPCNVCNHVFKSKEDLLKHFFIHKTLQGSYLQFTND